MVGAVTGLHQEIAAANQEYGREYTAQVVQSLLLPCLTYRKKRNWLGA
jgi:hypothetical protein